MIDLLLNVPPVAPAGHPIPVSETIANIIRIVLMLMEAKLCGKIIFGLTDKRSYMHYLPWERRIAWIGVFVFVARNLYVQVAQFGNAVVWEGAPWTFIGLCFFLWAVRKVRVPVHISEPRPIPEMVGEEPRRDRRAGDGPPDQPRSVQVMK
jgi:hypothetical protein